MATLAFRIGGTWLADFVFFEPHLCAGIDGVVDATDCEGVSEVDTAGGAFTVLRPHRQYRILAWHRFGIDPH